MIFLLLFRTVEFKLTDGFGNGIVFVLAAFLGFLHGGRNTITSLIWAVFCGRSARGSIYGFSVPFRSAANACGPIFAAICFDLFGSSALPFYLFAAIFFVSGVNSIRL